MFQFDFDEFVKEYDNTWKPQIVSVFNEAWSQEDYDRPESEKCKIVPKHDMFKGQRRIREKLSGFQKIDLKSAVEEIISSAEKR